MKIKTKFSFASFALFSVKLCLIRGNKQANNNIINH